MNPSHTQDADMMERLILPIIRQRGAAKGQKIIAAIAPVFAIIGQWTPDIRQEGCWFKPTPHRRACLELVARVVYGGRVSKTAGRTAGGTTIHSTKRTDSTDTFTLYQHSNAQQPRQGPSTPSDHR